MLQTWRGPLTKSNADQEDVIGNLFEIELENTLKCLENPDEPHTSSMEKVLRLSCHIDNNNKPIDLIEEGIKISLEGQIDKRSQTLGRDAIYNKESKINKLPQYLCVQFVRFYWKQGSDISDTKAGKSKILRSVAFGKNLSVHEFCSDSLKASLLQGKEFQAKMADEAEEKRVANQKIDVVMEETKDDNNQKLVGKAAKSMMKAERVKKEDEILYREHGQGLDTGDYGLVGIVTHKGRSAEGGHYIGWVHASGDDWLKCDDDIVTVVKTEDILLLKGGGDRDTAYLNLYRRLEVTKGDAM